MQDDTDARPMYRPNAHAIAAHVTPFPDFTADDDEWRVCDAAYQSAAELLQRMIDAEVSAC